MRSKRINPEPTTKEQRRIAAIKDWTGDRLIGDDCAILPGHGLVTVDTLVEGTHFLLPGISYADLGWKTMAVNLSDIAAMAGRPRFAFSSLTLPDNLQDADFHKLYEGMVACAHTYRCKIAGGDLTRGELMVLTVTLIGDEHECGVMLRGGARPGDIVVATGDFGASAAGLWLIKNGLPGYAYCRRRHFRPLPRLCESWALVRQTRGRGALMDASDGLADALIQVARASGVGITVEASAVPIQEETQAVAQLAGNDPLDWAFYGGEDYELVGCVAAEDWAGLCRNPDNPFVRIGTVQAEPLGVSALMPGGGRQAITLDKTFQHWS